MKVMFQAIGKIVYKDNFNYVTQALMGNRHQGLVVTNNVVTVKILKIGTPEIITIIVLQLEQLDFTVQYCVQKMQTE